MPDRTVFERLDIPPLMDRDVDLDDDVAQAFRDIGFVGDYLRLVDKNGVVLLSADGYQLFVKEE